MKCAFLSKAAPYFAAKHRHGTSTRLSMRNTNLAQLVRTGLSADPAEGFVEVGGHWSAAVRTWVSGLDFDDAVAAANPTNFDESQGAGVRGMTCDRLVRTRS